MTWRTARGFASGGLAAGADDLARIEQRGDEIAIVIANASSAPFEVVAPSLSRKLIDSALAAWRRKASPAEAIKHAVSALSKSNAETPMGWMLFVQLGADIQLAWVGIEEAWLIANGTIALRTAPHSLREQHGAPAPEVATRSLLTDEAVEPDTATWQRIPGARLVCATASVARLDASDAISLATAGDLGTCACELAEATVREHPGRPAAVIIAEAQTTIGFNLYLEHEPAGGMHRVLDVMRAAGGQRIGSTSAVRVPIDVALAEPDMLRFADKIEVAGIEWSGAATSGSVWSITGVGVARANDVFEHLLTVSHVDFAVCHPVPASGSDVESERAAILCGCPAIVYRDKGPAGLGARTVLGPRILAMLDAPTRDALVRGGELRDDGRLVIIDPSRELQDRFVASGVAMQIQARGRATPGPKWVPLRDAPGPARPTGDAAVVIDRLQSVRFADGDPPVKDVGCSELFAPFERLESAHAEMLQLENAVLAYSELSGSVIHEANFTGADLHGVDARGAQWIDASFDSADLRWANCARIRLPLSRLDHANCTDIDLTDATGPEMAEGACFDRASGERWSPAGALLTRATFRDANLRGACFDNALLQGAVFDGADLTDASFRNADLRSASFIGASTTNIDLTGAKQ